MLKNAFLKQGYTYLKLFNDFKMANSCCFVLGGNLYCPELLQKSFIASTTGHLLHFLVGGRGGREPATA